MNQNSNLVLPQDQWLGEVMKTEQAILDGHMPPDEQLLAIPADIRMKSPLLLRAECENGLLSGRLLETKQRLEAALRGFAAQADDSSMLTMMAMLGLLYIQVGDLQESKPFVELLSQEWERTPLNCSGFVPWVLARATVNSSHHATRFHEGRNLLIAAAERFREEGRPLWASFVLLDMVIFNPEERSHADWPFWLNWLKRHAAEHPAAAPVVRLLASAAPDAAMCEQLPVRFAYLSKAVLLNDAEEQLPEALADDIESGIYAAGAAVTRHLAESRPEAAAEALLLLNRRRRFVSSPAIERLAAALEAQLQAPSESATEVEQPQAPGAEDKMSQPSGGSHVPAQQLPPLKWKVKLIDGVSLSSENGQWVEPIWKRRKAGELFVYLLLQPAYKSNREHVIERVFGEGDSTKRYNQLYVTLHDLRFALREVGFQDDAIYAKRGVIGISEAVIESVDVETLITLSRVGDQLWMDDREEAVRLYDKALPLYGWIAAELSQTEWLDRVREQLLDRQTAMLKRLSIFYGEQRDDTRQEQRLSDWIALRPDQEEAYELMIRLCLRGRRRVEAISWYRRLERICQEELGTEPLDEVRKLLWN